MRAYLIVILLLLAILGSVGATIFLKTRSMAAMDFSAPPVTIAAAPAERAEWTDYLNAVGTIRAVRGIDLTSESSGEITAINFDSGDAVTAGALLLVLNDRVEQASLENQLAALELAEILYKRNSQLLQQNSVSQTAYDQSRADLARTRAALAETRARLRNKRIHAPFDGRIGIRRVNLGDYVSPGTVIATLQDVSELEIDFTLPARHASQLSTGLPVSVQVDAWPERRFQARVTAMDARVDPGTRNLLVRARLENTEGLLPGMFATLQVKTARSTPVVVVPETAVTYSLQGNVVHVVTPSADGGLTTEARVVEVGEIREGRAGVLSGLSGDEQVVIAGQNKLYRGVAVIVDDSVVL